MKTFYTVDLWITFLFCTALGTGSFFLFKSSLTTQYVRYKLNRKLIQRRPELRVLPPWEAWLRQAFLITIGREVSPRMFLLLISAMTLWIAWLGLNTFSFLPAIMLSLMTATFPVLMLWIRLSAIRRKGSHEGERLISEFLSQYRLANYNIYETLERMVNSKVELRTTKKLLYRLLLELRDTGNPSKIKKATNTFAYGIKTNWGLMLAHTIEIAATEGSNVSYAIEDILIQLREARTLFEDRKRMNSEAMRMAYWMVPLLYGTTVIMAIRYLELPLVRFLQNQFYTPEGLLFFLAIGFLFVANIGLLSLITNQKFDY